MPYKILALILKCTKQRHTLYPRGGSAQGGSKAGRGQAWVRGFVFKLRVAFLAYLLPELAHLDTSERGPEKSSSQLSQAQVLPVPSPSEVEPGHAHTASSAHSWSSCHPQHTTSPCCTLPASWESTQPLFLTLLPKAGQQTALS